MPRFRQNDAPAAQASFATGKLKNLNNFKNLEN
jgi:hypothetical protein